MRPERLLLALLLAATVALGACASTEMIRYDTPRRIAADPSLQFDFTLPLLDEAAYRRIRVNVSFDGQATFYMRDTEQPYRRIKKTTLTDETRRHLARLFEEADFARYPTLVPRSGEVAMPAHVVQLGYRAAQGRAPRTVSGAVSTQPDVEAYPEGFFALMDGLVHFVRETGTFRIRTLPDQPLLSGDGE